MKKNYSQNYVAVLLEDMNSKFDRMAEVLAGVVETQNIHTKKLEKLDNIETDVATMKSVLIEHSTELKDHRSRIGKLESNVFG